MCRKSESEHFLFADSCEKVSCYDVWLKSCSVKFASLPTARGFQLRAVGGCGGHGEAACAGIRVGLQVLLNLLCMQYHVQMTLQMTNKYDCTLFLKSLFPCGNLGVISLMSLQKDGFRFGTFVSKNA